MRCAARFATSRSFRGSRARTTRAGSSRGPGELADVLRADPQGGARRSGFRAALGRAAAQKRALVATSGVGDRGGRADRVGLPGRGAAALFDDGVRAGFGDRRGGARHRRPISLWDTPRQQQPTGLVRRGGTAASLAAWGFNLVRVPPLRPARLLEVRHAVWSCSASRTKTPSSRRSSSWKRRSARWTTTCGSARPA